MNLGEGLLHQNVTLLLLRERELLSLRRQQDRVEAWLSLAQYLAAESDASADRDRLLRYVSEAFKSILPFQEVAFFEAAGKSLAPIGLDPDIEGAAPLLDDRATGAVFSAKDGRVSESEADGTSRRFHRFFWHWIDGVDPQLLFVVGYDRETSEFYPPFDDRDFAHFAMVGRVLDPLLANVRAGHEHASPLLTGREVEVSRLLARGKTNKEIGVLLGISSRTVQTHVANIFEKLGVRNRAGAATWLVEHRVGV